MGREFGGLEFSGGQWQKLAIARGFYMNREILVLDEPSSALDPLAERELYRELFEQASDKTMIVITHRIASAIWADKIYVFQNGKVVEEGNHADLLSRKGVYEKLFSSQAKWYE